MTLAPRRKAIRLELHFLDNIDAIAAQDWNRIAGTSQPFLRHEFLSALEATGCADAETGWLPRHAVLKDTHDRLIGLVPLYIKSHSMGEYVFDWAWADFWQRNGRAYYPKFLTAIPFSPCNGPRLCVDPELSAQEAQAVRQALIDGVITAAQRQGVSGWHVLFGDEHAASACREKGLLERRAWRYQWQNQGYADFDGFLAALTSKRRKTIRRELRQVAEQGIEFEQIEGERIRPQHWDQFYRFYHATYLKHGRFGYLTRKFFEQIARTLPEHLLLVMARENGQPIGAAFFLRSEDTLYGRYWGCIEERECMHFAACYYQGIDYCIRRGLQYFDPGTQGEHKIPRGFLPLPSPSFHWIADEPFIAPLRHFLDEEAILVDQVTKDLAQRSPFRTPES